MSYTDTLKKIQDLVEIIERDQREHTANENIFVYAITGRKYAKICICHRDPHSGHETTHIRYFVDYETDNIYGARSRNAPNLRWYFGDLNRCNLWYWGEFHARPVNDPEIHVAGQYAGYIRYIKS